MVCIIRRRSKIYKRLRVDIWGKFSTYVSTEREKKTKDKDQVIKYWANVRRLYKEYRKFRRQRYVYKLWGRRKFEFPKKLKKNYVIPRIVRNYYIFMKKKIINRKVKKAKREMGKYIENFIRSMEGRLLNVIYRSNFVTNIFMVKDLITSGVVRVNKKKITYSNYIVGLGDFLEIIKPWNIIIKKDMLIRLKKNILITPQQPHLYINYNLLCLFMLRYLKKKELIYPTNLDINRVLDFVGPLR